MKDKTNAFITGLLGCFCLICAIALIMNCTLIIRSYTNKQEIPSIGGIFPLVVLSDSMHPKIQSGDLIVCEKVNVNDIDEGDIICFYDSPKKTTLVTHRVVDVVLKDGSIVFKTKGDANNKEDDTLVPSDHVVGIYKTRLPKVGHVVLFMQSKTGLFIVTALPLIGVIVSIMKSKKKKDQDIETLRNELNLLRNQI